VTVWTNVFLGIIAGAVVVTSLFLIAAIVSAALLARKLTHLSQRIDEQLTPLFGHLDAIGRDAARASALAVAQVERADGLFADFSSRVERTMDVVQHAAGMPAREGAAILAGIRAALHTLGTVRHGHPRARGRGEDDDALFI
jgi:hypothetical protein